MRRAAFGARLEDLERLANIGYDAVLANLLSSTNYENVDQDILDRFYPTSTEGGDETISIGHWMHRVALGNCPLQEKMALFWHHVFATGSEKVGHPFASQHQFQKFRRIGLTNFRDILVTISKDPAMIMWLDNNQNFRDNPNENYGRELLELFSMGVGNYTEKDVKATTQAFTGWTFTWSLRQSGMRDAFPTKFELIQSDHDDSIKTFLGETGKFNGEDIIDLIVRQPATARFLSRHLYTFFVSDEPPVASWNEFPPQNAEAIDILMKAFLESNGDIRHMLGVLFSSQFFKQAIFQRVKSPVELVAGLMNLIGPEQLPDFDASQHASAAGEMGQNLLNPLTVEGWHTGKEWIDGGTLSTRVDYSVDQVNDISKPGIKKIFERFSARGTMSPTRFVDNCIELAGLVPIQAETREGLIEHARGEGPLKLEGKPDTANQARIIRMLQLIVATREYQFN